MRKLIIGAAQFGMDYGIANRNGRVQENEIESILDLAWKNGIYTIDTAKAYGSSEQSIGKYLERHNGVSWNIITKLSKTGRDIISQIQDSEKKLTLCPSVVLAHSTELFLDAEFQLELAKIRENKLIRKTGVSLYTENEINQVLNSTFIPEVIQIPLNIIDTKLYRNGILDQLSDKCIEIHVRSVFLQGLFYMQESDLENSFSGIVPYIQRLRSVASEVELTLAELSLLWIFSLKEVSKIIIGIDNAEQLKGHLQTLKKKVDPTIFEKALSVHYENENFLNPSLWS